MKDKEQTLIHARAILQSLLGIAAYALTMDLFLAENQIAAGGVSGLAVICSHFIPLSLGIITLLLNLPILLLSEFMNGFRYTANALLGAVLQALLIDGLSFLPCLTTDPLVAAVFGGTLYGFGMAMLTRGGGSTGGTDLLNRTLLKKCPTMSIGKMSMILDGAVVILSMVAFSNIEVGLYAIITLFVCSLTADQILVGYDRGSISLVITSSDPETVAQPLMKMTGRGVTNLKGTGMYSGTERNILMLGVRPKEVHKVKDVLKEVDPEAFVILLPANELIGGHFRADHYGRRP
ncbi:MAG: YitT family protein [Candidatus Limivicinus sp.]|jgi:uncharacterized membrane-anchored protein YitT (DUF2179 family)